MVNAEAGTSGRDYMAVKIADGTVSVVETLDFIVADRFRLEHIYWFAHGELAFCHN